jgi:hypothetical protein
MNTDDRFVAPVRRLCYLGHLRRRAAMEQIYREGHSGDSGYVEVVSKS